MDVELDIKVGISEEVRMRIRMDVTRGVKRIPRSLLADSYLLLCFTPSSFNKFACFMQDESNKCMVLVL
ncbi:hypothetical protein CCMA1212_005731 [Trichoderma ghanense]|uniref:Uncharacterized protein n=1 Tax=Trichoderma ghanense TaxID=65468 RepID=A0ABY2H1V8_9HYPO